MYDLLQILWENKYNCEYVKWEKSYPGINAQARIDDTNSIYLDIPLYTKKKITNNCSSIEMANLNEINSSLSDILQPTTSGKKVSITYKVFIKLDYGTCCTAVPKCSIPLFIESPSQDLIEISPPENWDPVVYEKFTFSLDDIEAQTNVSSNQPVSEEECKLLESSEPYQHCQDYLEGIAFSSMKL